MLIFVAIASYRDSELAPTIADCLAKATHPEQLRFGICRQFASDEADLPWRQDPRFRILDVPWQESRGACWARAEVMKLLAQEDYYLQLDSHHRFAPEWDTKLLTWAAQTGSAKPLLTTYGWSYEVGQPLEPGMATRLDFDEFTAEGIVLCKSMTLPGGADAEVPFPARFASGHLLFAPSSFVRDVPYDPEMYFIGEEIMLAIRAYSHGYDLFHPPQHVVWHEYSRKYRTLHWADHDGEVVQTSWKERDHSSRVRVAAFLHRPFVGPFGLGTARSLADYEAYAGISFAHRLVQDATRVGTLPPNPPARPDWQHSLRNRRTAVRLSPAVLDNAAAASHVRLQVHASDGALLYNESLLRDEFAAVAIPDRQMLLVVLDFVAEQAPATFSLYGSNPVVALSWPLARFDNVPTFVTAIAGGGADPEDPLHPTTTDDARLATFSALLAVDCQLIVYCDAAWHDFVAERRDPLRTRIVVSEAAGITGSASLLTCLSTEASANPFGSTHLYALDPMIGTSVPQELLAEPHFGLRLNEVTSELFCLALENLDGPEPGRYAVYGGLFGGTAAAIAEAAAKVADLRQELSAHGLPDSDAACLTALLNRDPLSFACLRADDEAMIAPCLTVLTMGVAEAPWLTTADLLAD